MRILLISPRSRLQTPEVTTSEYDRLVAEAIAAPIEGWDFSWLAGRVEGSDPSWSYRELARAHLASAERVLDIDTGGGELLASLGPLSAQTWATEGWPPNIDVARRRLEPLGVTVLPAPDPDELPISDASVDLVLNRHGRLVAPEIKRVLRRGGVLVTQQVGSDDCADLNNWLGAPPMRPPGSWTLRTANEALSAVGIRPTITREERPLFTFYDIGAVIYHLRLVTWQIPGFSPELYDAPLRRLHEHLRETGRVDVKAHRFLVVAERL
jgi:SAM-dependent methyltransferase